MTFTRRPQKSLAEAFMEKVVKGDGCWIGPGETLRFGHKRFPYGGRRMLSHRVSWEIHFGPIAPGLFVCHRCDNPPCCRPDHLFLGTTADNMQDMARKGRSGATVHPDKVGRGESNSAAKLTADQVRAIRSEYAAGGVTFAAIGATYGIAGATASDIVHRRRWTHLD